MDLDQQQSQLKLLIAKGKDQGYLTYHEVNDHLPEGIVDPEQIEDIISMINDMGITVHEVPPDADSLLMMENAVSTDEDAAEEAAEQNEEAARERKDLLEASNSRRKKKMSKKHVLRY